jgi:hypothetical protein
MLTGKKIGEVEKETACWKRRNDINMSETHFYTRTWNVKLVFFSDLTLTGLELEFSLFAHHSCPFSFNMCKWTRDNPLFEVFPSGIPSPVSYLNTEQEKAKSIWYYIQEWKTCILSTAGNKWELPRVTYIPCRLRFRCIDFFYDFYCFRESLQPHVIELSRNQWVIFSAITADIRRKLQKCTCRQKSKCSS